MAGASATSNGANEKRSEEPEGGKKGWLAKKTQFTRRWKPVWFHIKDSQLYYGGNEQEYYDRTFLVGVRNIQRRPSQSVGGRARQTPVKSISLIGAEVEALEDDTCFSWTIKPQNRKRTYILKAGSAEEQQQWMVALVEAQMSSKEHAVNACVLQ